MSRSLFSIDGTEYPNIHVVSLKRSFSVLDGDNAGRLMSGEMSRDVIGTYYNYSVEIDPSGAAPETYDALYEVISAPQDSHLIIVPYGQTTLAFNAYVSNGEDALLFVGGKNRWGNLTFNFVAMAPNRVPN